MIDPAEYIVREVGARGVLQRLRYEASQNKLQGCNSQLFIIDTQNTPPNQCCVYSTCTFNSCKRRSQREGMRQICQHTRGEALKGTGTAKWCPNGEAECANIADGPALRSARCDQQLA